MDKNKKWFLVTITMTAGLLLITASITIFVDPFFHYHGPRQGLAYYFSREPYQNPGIAKNFEYDTAFLGSCMSENFNVSYFDSMNDNMTYSIKIPHQAAYEANVAQYAKIICENNDDIKSIYWGIDIWACEVDSTELHDPIPDYLLDGNLFTDVNYLFNKTVLEDWDARIIKNTTLGAQMQTRDKMWNWSDSTEFSKEIALQNREDVNADLLTSQDVAWNNMSDNLHDNIISVVEANPDVEFIFFYPPYSIEFWKQNSDNDILDFRLEEMKYIEENLLTYDNVKFYDFQGEESIITDLMLYKDSVHYNSQVNDWMLESFINGTDEITRNNMTQATENKEKLFIKYEDSDYNR